MTEPQTSFLLRARLLGALTGVRGEERRSAFAALFTLASFMAGHALLETARDALFLASWPASALPWAYLAIAGLALLLGRSPPRLPWSRRPEDDLGAWLTLAGVGTASLWVLLGFAGNWIYYGLYIWSGVVATLVVVRFWTVLADRFTVTQAKRLFTIIGVGSVLGAIVGSGLARILTEWLPVRHLVLVAAVLFGVASYGSRLLGAATGSTSTRERDAAPARAWDPAEALRLIASRPYLVRVAALILSAAVTFTLVDYVFKSAADRLVPPEQLGEFFASVYLALNVLALIVQAGVVSWLLRSFGVGTFQVLAPALLLVASLGYLALPTLGLALLLKGADGSTRHSLYRTGTELLFVPMSVDVRGRVKALIDVVGQRGGQALASLLILAVLPLGRGETAVAIVAVIVACTWLVLALDLRGHYVSVFRETLRDRVTATRIDFPALDMASLETLLATLNEPDDRKVLAALDLLEIQGKLRVVPALILYHPSEQVVHRALELFVAGGREDVVPIVDRLVSASDPGTVAAAIRARCALRPEEGPLLAAREHPDAGVRATAIVALSASGWLHPEGVVQEISALLDQYEGTHLVLLRALQDLPTGAFDETVIRLADSTTAQVRLEAVRAMGRIGNPTFLSTLIGLLARRELREPVREALLAIGPTALAYLEQALGDRAVPHAVARHLPRAIADFGSPRAAEILVRRLTVESDGMIRFKTLRALGRLRARSPGVILDSKVLDRAASQTLGRAFSYMRWRRALAYELPQELLGPETAAGTLVTLLADKERHALERLFRLFNLMTGDEDFARAYRGLESDELRSRAESRELVEHLVLSRYREACLELVDDVFEAGAYHRPVLTNRSAVLTAEGALEELLACDVDSLEWLAAVAIEELDTPVVAADGGLRLETTLVVRAATVRSDRVSRGGGA